MQTEPSRGLPGLRPFVTPDKTGEFRDGRIRMIQHVTWNTAPSKWEPAPFHDPVTGIRAASWARIDNREELAGKLGMPRTRIQGMCDTQLICRCYIKWGDDCTRHLVGDFAFVIYDESAGRIFCGRDHMGVRPFYYYLSGERFICATSLPPILGTKGVDLSIRQQWIVDYLLFMSMSFDRTPYGRIFKLPPAHTLAVARETHSLRRYFSLHNIPELRLKDPREYVDAYREQLETAVKCRLETTYPLGTELSGGLDSSSITACAANNFNRPRSWFHAFGFAHCEQVAPAIAAVSRACGLSQTHVIADWPDSGAEPERSLGSLGYPEEQMNAGLHTPFYRKARELGVRTLLSGFGGDEFTTTIHGHLAVPELFYNRRYRDLIRILPTRPHIGFTLLAKLFAKQILTRNFKRPGYNRALYRAFRERWPHHIVSNDLVRKYDLRKRYFEGARFDAGYTDLKRFTLEKRWQPFIPTRMENGSLMAAGYNIDYRWPLLDIRLVRLFFQIPSEAHYFRGMGRYLHRTAVAPLLPREIVWKQTKDMGNILAAGFRKPPELPRDFLPRLHPLLKEIVNLKKTESQVASLAFNEQTRLHIFLYKKKILENLKRLDQWLKQCPGGN